MSSSSFPLSDLSNTQLNLLEAAVRDSLDARLKEERDARNNTRQLRVGYFPVEWTLAKKRHAVEVMLKAVTLNEEEKHPWERIFINPNDTVALVTFTSAKVAQACKWRLERKFHQELKLVEPYVESMNQGGGGGVEDAEGMSPAFRFFESLSVSVLNRYLHEIRQAQQVEVRTRKLRLGIINSPDLKDSMIARDFVIDALKTFAPLFGENDRAVSKSVYVAPHNLTEAIVEFYSTTDCHRVHQEVQQCGHPKFKYAELIREE